MPRHWPLTRPRGSTAVASIRTNPAPESARLPTCTGCHSDARPSRSAEYCPIGDTTIRFSKVTERSDIGENNLVFFGMFLEIGRAHVGPPVTTAPTVCRL